MATKRSRPRDGAPTVRSGRDLSPGGTRQLPPNFDRLAAGEDRLPRPPRGPDQRVRDPRERVLIPGTNNRDSRGLYDRRLSALRADLARGDTQAVGDGLLEFCQLGLYRARNVVDFDAFASSVLGVSLDQARELSAAAAQRRGATGERLPEVLAALWIRSEAALREHSPQARVILTGHGDDAQLELRLPCQPIGGAVDALSALGRQVAGLGRHLPEPPREPGLAPRPTQTFRGGAEQPASTSRQERTPRERRPTVPMRGSSPPRRQRIPTPRNS